MNKEVIDFILNQISEYALWSLFADEVEDCLVTWANKLIRSWQKDKKYKYSFYEDDYHKDICMTAFAAGYETAITLGGCSEAVNEDLCEIETHPAGVRNLMQDGVDDGYVFPEYMQSLLKDLNEDYDNNFNDEVDPINYFLAGWSFVASKVWEDLITDSPEMLEDAGIRDMLGCDHPLVVEWNEKKRK